MNHSSLNLYNGVIFGAGIRTVEAVPFALDLVEVDDSLLYL